MVGRHVLAATPQNVDRSPTHRVVNLTGLAAEATIYLRSALPAGFTASGPAIVEEASATTVVMAGQSFTVDEFGNLILTAAA